MVAVLLASAEAGAEAGSPTLFYVAGLVLAAFAVAVSVAGLVRSGFPERAARAVMALAAALVAFTMVASVVSSG